MSRAGGPTARPGAPALGLGLSQLFFLIWSLSSSVAKSDLREDVTHLLSACCGRGGPSREAGLREAGQGDVARSPGPLLWGWCHPPTPAVGKTRGCSVSMPTHTPGSGSSAQHSADRHPCFRRGAGTPAQLGGTELLGGQAGVGPCAWGAGARRQVPFPACRLRAGTLHRPPAPTGSHRLHR